MTDITRVIRRAALPVRRYPPDKARAPCIPVGTGKKAPWGRGDGPRDNSEWRLGHYPGAVHIPVNKLGKRTTSKLPKKGLLVYCNTGQRARFAAEKLVELGFTEVYYISGLYTDLL